MKRMFLSLALCLCVGFLSACSTLGMHKPNCYESVAVSKITIEEAYKSAADASEAELISVGAAKEALRILDSANIAADKASGLCAIDERSAYDYLQKASEGVAEISKMLREEQINEQIR